MDQGNTCPTSTEAGVAQPEELGVLGAGVPDGSGKWHQEPQKAPAREKALWPSQVWKPLIQKGQPVSPLPGREQHLAVMPTP